MNRTLLKVLLVRHEGKRNKPYLDCCGKPWRECQCSKKGNLTIGVGRNLDAEGLSDDEVGLLLDNDINNTWRSCQHILGFTALDDTRQHVLMDMCLNLGYAGLVAFKQMLKAVEQHLFGAAADEILDSEAAKQAPGRYQDLSRMMREGTPTPNPQ